MRGVWQLTRRSRSTERKRTAWLGAALGFAAAGAVAAAVARQRNRERFESLVAKRLPLNADGIVRGAEPVFMHGSASHAVLLVHGFGDTPQSVRPLADALNAAGWTVYSMLLPGHGRPLAQYARTRARDWTRAVEAVYADLRLQYATVVVCGISMGAALSTILAARVPELPALVLLAPYFSMSPEMRWKTVAARLSAFPVPYHVSRGGELSIHDPAARARTLGIGVVTARLLSELRWVAHRAERALPRVRARTLYLQSREDNRVDAVAALRHFARLGSPVKAQRWLSGCGHIITVDYCKDEVARQVVEWFAPCLSQPAAVTAAHQQG